MRDVWEKMVFPLLAVFLWSVLLGPSLHAGPSYSPNLERAQTFVEREEYREALPFLRASIERTRSPEALFLRGHVFLKLHRPSEAMTDAETLLRVFPSDWRGYYLKARVYLQKTPSSQPRTKLINALRDTLKRKPDHEQARLHLAEVLARCGQLQKALDAFRRVREVLDEHPETARIAARVAFLRNEPDLALNLSNNVLRLLPHDSLAARIRSFVRNNVSSSVERRIWTLERDSENQLSDQTLRELQSQYSNIAHVLLFCGRRYLERGQLDRGRTVAKKAEQVQGDAWTAFLLGRIFETDETYDRAAEWYETSTRRRTPFPEGQLRAGVCHSRSSRHERAIRILRSVLDRVIVDREAGERLVQSCLKTGHIVFARRHLSQLNLSDERRTSFKKKLDHKLSRRRDREEEAFSDGEYRNELYGIRLNLSDGWSHALDAGRPEVLALFAHLKRKGRLFIVAERRLPSFQHGLNKDEVRSALRPYVISNALREQSGLRYLRQHEFDGMDRPAIEFVFRERKNGRRMHAVVTFHDEWMITFYLYQRSAAIPDSDTWMKEILKRAIIQEK